MPAIIMGDLNTWEPAAVDKTSRLFPAENFSTPFDPSQPTFSRTILIIPIKLKLDWIWLRGLEATSHGIAEEIDLSDHWPLWVVVRMSKGRSRET
jgi:endonuclease/exonuclease/phosphatase family metal-dependent hydrolase